MSASAVSGLAALSGPSSGLSSDPCSPIPPGPVTGLRRWLDHSKHCLSVETEAESGQTGQCEVSRESHRRRTLGKSAGWGHWPLGKPSTVDHLSHWLCLPLISLCPELDAGANFNHRTRAARTDLTDYIAGGSWRQGTGEEIELGM